MGDSTLVQTAKGALRGAEQVSALGHKYFSYLRIPYARPPVGDLRFKSPEPVEPWDEVLDCTTGGSIPPATEYITQVYEEKSDEDCLHINVYSKKMDGDKLPVLVFIYGGGFTSGSGCKDLYGPDFFMIHDAVLVTFNYRVGALGFLSLQSNQCPGNFGLKDQRLALQWVQENISYFNGDPNNVTLFGESAGGASVHYHFLNPASKGLFHRVIIQSGAATNRWAYARHPRESAYILGKRLGCEAKSDEELLDFLRKAPVKDIVMKSIGIPGEIEAFLPGEEVVSFPFIPTAEPESKDAILTKTPQELVASGTYLDVPFITGVCTKEMLFGIRGKEKTSKCTTVEDIHGLIPRDLGFEEGSPQALEAAQKIKNFYFPNGIDFDSYVDVLSATFFNYNIYQTVKHHINNPKRTSKDYLYVFSYEGQRGWVKIMLDEKNTPGTFHGDELGYLFSIPDLPIPEKNTSDYDVIKSLTQLWVNFSRTGEPTLSKTWPPVDANLQYLDMGDTFSPKKGFFIKEMEMWDDIYKLKKSV